MWGNHVRWDSKICFAYLEFFHGTLEGPWETRDHLDLEAKLHGIALKKTKRKLPTNTSSRQSWHVQDCMSLWQSDNCTSTSSVAREDWKAMEWWLSIVSGIGITNPKNGYLIMMAIGINNHVGNDRKMQPPSPMGCSHVSTLAKTTWILWMQTIVYECLITYSSSGLAGTPEDKTYNLP